MARLQDSGFGYDFLPGAGRHSLAVRARAGHLIQRVELATPVVHELAIELIVGHLDSLGLPGGSLCALELRSPRQSSFSDFEDHHRRYRHALGQLGVEADERINPVARTNVIPVVDPPADVSLHAFSHVIGVEDYVPGGLARLEDNFVISGSSEIPEPTTNHFDHIVARGDVSTDGLTRKIKWVVAEMGRRLHAVGASWQSVTRTQVYSTREIGGLLSEEVHRTTSQTFTWHASEPPVVELEFAMDCRRVGQETVLEPAVS